MYLILFRLNLILFNLNFNIYIKHCTTQYVVCTTYLIPIINFAITMFTLSRINNTHQILHNCDMHSLECLKNRSPEHISHNVITAFESYEYSSQFNFLSAASKSNNATPMIMYSPVEISIKLSKEVVYLCDTYSDYNIFVNYLMSNLDMVVHLLIDEIYSNSMKNLIYFCGSINLTPQDKLYLDMELQCH